MHGFDTKAGEGPVPGDPETAQSFRKSIRAASLCREITDGLHGLFYPSNYAQYGSFPVDGQTDDYGTLWRWGHRLREFICAMQPEGGFNSEFHEHMKMCARSRTTWTPDRTCSGQKEIQHEEWRRYA